MTDDEILPKNLERYIRIFNSSEIFNFDFSYESSTPTSKLFYKFIEKNFRFIKNTEFGKLYTHIFDGFHINAFLSDNRICQIITYFMDTGVFYIRDNIDNEKIYRNEEYSEKDIIAEITGVFSEDIVLSRGIPSSIGMERGDIKNTWLTEEEVKNLEKL